MAVQNIYFTSIMAMRPNRVVKIKLQAENESGFHYILVCSALLYKIMILVLIHKLMAQNYRP